jgi:hypothetical protein
MGYQVDDPSLRPREFLEKSREELEKIIGGDGGDLSLQSRISRPSAQLGRCCGETWSGADPMPQRKDLCWPKTSPVGERNTLH